MNGCLRYDKISSLELGRNEVRARRLVTYGVRTFRARTIHPTDCSFQIVGLQKCYLTVYYKLD